MSDSRFQDDFEEIAPAEVPLTRDEAPAAEPAGRRPPWFWAGAAVLGVLLIALLLLLPDALRPDLEGIASGTTEPAATPARDRSPRNAATEEAEAPVAPYQQSRLERERRAVEDLIARLLDLQEELDTMAVERWGAEPLAAARASADAGDEAFMAEAFDDARAQYQQAVAALEELIGAAEIAYREALTDGDAALAAGDSKSAHEAFDLAAAIRPDSEAARHGLARAAVLDRVLEQVAEARRMVAAGEYEAARDRLDAALELDAESAPARDLRAEVRTRIRDRDFNRALSRGYAALAEGRLDPARDAFRAALGLRNGAAEAEEGLLLVEQAATDRRIDELRREAESLMAAEDWETAAERYDAALELDATLSFARQGRARALALADVDARIRDTLAEPDALSDDRLLERARDLLGEARRMNPTHAGLAARIDALESLLAVAETPVTVRLRSDGATEVIILRVARLGTFEERSIELRPGRYTATGSRPGFRDVRLEFRVDPGSHDDPVVIRTEERI